MTTRSTRPASAAQKRLAQQRAAADRARVQAERRRRLMVVVSVGLTVVAVVAVLVAVKLASGSSGPKSGTQASAAGSSVAADIADVPPAVLDQVGIGTARGAPKALNGAPLVADGKPRILFIGAEWCPYCAAERWPLAVALSRFGTLTGLGQVSSSPTDVYPNTPTLTFHGASYTSAYLSLTAKEIYSNQVQGKSYAPLDSLDQADGALFTSAGSGFPFLDIGGKYLFNSASYDPQLLAGKTQQQVAAALSNPSSPIAKGIDGSANLITAAICSVTTNPPSGVCSSSAVVAAGRQLPGHG